MSREIKGLEEKDIVNRAEELLLASLKGSGYEYSFHLLTEQILRNFCSIKKDQEFFWFDGRMIHFDEVKENLQHFVDYYLRDDGDVTLENGELHFCQDNGMTKIVLACYIIEKLTFNQDTK